MTVKKSAFTAMKPETTMWFHPLPSSWFVSLNGIRMESWDCSCHGSRFDYKGNLIDNPAQEDLCHD
ncbi:MAG: hypothetical protein ACLVHV_16070 [Oscillospiraceae bacterium]